MGRPNYVLIILCDPAREANSNNFNIHHIICDRARSHDRQWQEFVIALGHTTFNGKNERKERGGPKLEHTSLNHWVSCNEV